jgi:hypothetical protein
LELERWESMLVQENYQENRPVTREIIIIIIIAILGD